MNAITLPDKLAGFLDSIGSFSEEGILWFEPEKKEKLYHYTTLDGLRGVVENSDLWLTHAEYCNDEEQLRHGMRLTQKMIEEAPRSSEPHRRFLAWISTEGS